MAKNTNNATAAAQTTPSPEAQAVPALPRMPRLPRAKKVPAVPCGCGCGVLVARRFVPGHDSKLHAWVIRVERGIVALSDITHDGIRAAVRHEVAARKAEAKTAEAVA